MKTLYKISLVVFFISAGCIPALANTPNTSQDNEALLLADSSDKQNLHNNKCLQTLNDNDKVIVSVAFHSGAGGFTQLKELISRKPWGEAAHPALDEEIKTLIKQQSPFLIATMTKSQALQLEDHRDLIKWILVQSTEKACA